MTKAELTKIAHDNCILDCEMENAIQFVQDLLEFWANKIEKDEPYATNTIRRLRDAACEVWGLQNCLEDAMEEK